MRLLAFFFLTAAALSAQTRQDYAVFFPVTDYNGGWAQLPNTLSECNDLAADLRTLYGFQAEVLPNKTKLEIKTKLAELVEKTYGPDDQLLLFFSMHGYFDEVGEAGCLCPFGAKVNDATFESWLLHTELRALVARIPCEHILIIIDACYSGTFGGKKGKPGEAAYTESPDCQANIRQALQRKTRYYIAAGAKERVPANSALVKKMRSALGGRYSGEDGILALKELLGVLSEARPEPRDGEFTGDLGGGFVFVPKTACGSKPNPNPQDPDLAAWNYAQNEDTEPAYQFYLDSWPAGRYRVEARQALRRIQEERVWQAALQNGSIATFQSYLASYCPGGLHCAEAEKKAKPDTQKPEAGTDTDDGLVFVKGGTFMMGCTSEQQNCEDDEKPTHQVTVSDFYIGKYEVTQAQWRSVMGSDPPKLYNKGCDDCPVEMVSWDDVQEFIKKLNQQTGRQYRLPTEAEWEYAARGGEKKGGRQYAGSDNIDDVAWYSSNRETANTFGAQKTTHPVGTKQANELGLYDMTGNVSEWCSDWYGKNYFKKRPSSNPTGPSSGSNRVIRGGSRSHTPQYCRVANRNDYAPGDRSDYIGFRLARTK